MSRFPVEARTTSRLATTTAMGRCSSTNGARARTSWRSRRPSASDEGIRVARAPAAPSGRDDGHPGRARRAVELAVADLGRPTHLTVACRAPQLEHQLVDLPEAGGADRLPVRDE